jgi:hypothetical protein
VSIDLRGLRWSAATRSGGGASAASSLRPSRDCRSGYGGRERSPAHDLALVRLAPSSEARGAHRVAPCWLPALPPRRFDGHGVFLGVPDFRDWVPEDPLLKFASPSKPNRVSTARPQVSRWPLTQPVRGPFRPGSPLLGFLLPRALYAGRPVRPRDDLLLAAKIDSWRVRVATPPPVPSSGFLPLSTVLAAFAARTDSSRSPPFAVTPRRFAALFHAARAHWSRPSELSLPEEPCPISRAFASLRVRVRPPNDAARARTSRPLSPARRPVAEAYPKVRRTLGP